MKQKIDKTQTINQFCIYDVVFYENPQSNAFATIKAQDALNRAHNILAKLLSGKQLALSRDVTRDGERTTEYLMNDILSNHEEVYLLRINNNKYKTLTKEAPTTTNGVRDFEDIQELSNPYCYIVIDNREDRHFMAIQKNSAFGDPNTVRKIIENSINFILRSENLPIEMNLFLRTRPSKIWEFCEKQCNENGDAITRIAFIFPNQKKVDMAHRIPKMQQGILKKIAQVAEYTDALKTMIQMDYNAADTSKLEQHANNFAEICRICNSTEYNLSIHFRDYGKYICDDHVKAMFPMREELITAFRTHWKEVPFDHEFGLISWCDEMYVKSEIYKDRAQTPKKRKRKNKR